jgi:hypothetical protein
MFLMSAVTPADALCCALFIYHILCWCWHPEIGINYNNWVQLSRFHMKKETESSLGNAVF